MSPRRSSQTKFPRLFVVSAPSGAGKTTLCEMLIKDHPNIGLSLSATTRTMRPYEKNGVHYQFLTQPQFQQKIDRGEFAEWAEVHEHWYGTPKTEIERRLKEGKHVLFDIDVQGARSLLKAYPDRVCLIFIRPPSMEILQKRLVERKGDPVRSIETRLQNAYNELEWSKIFDYQVTNDELSRAYLQLKEIVEAECQ
jgi:guanylate kinase